MLSSFKGCAPSKVAFYWLTSIKDCLLSKVFSIKGILQSKVTFHQSQSSIKGCLLSKVFHQKQSSIKGCLPSKVVFRKRSSSLKRHLPPKVVFYQRLSFIKGCLASKAGLSYIKCRLPLNVIFHQRVCHIKGRPSSKVIFHQRVSSQIKEKSGLQLNLLVVDICGGRIIVVLIVVVGVVIGVKQTQLRACPRSLTKITNIFFRAQENKHRHKCEEDVLKIQSSLC